MRRFAKATLPVITAVTLLILGTATVSMAGAFSDGISGITTPNVPEIDVATGWAALGLVAASVLVIRGRSKKK